MMSQIILNVNEVTRACDLARRRQRDSEARGLSGKHGGESVGEESLTLHVRGCLGEFGICKEMDWPEPTSVGAFGKPDFEIANWRIHMRTRGLSGHELIVRDDDVSLGYATSDDIYIRATVKLLPKGIEPVLVFLDGWCAGDQCCQPPWRHSYGGREEAWFVPSTQLRSLTDLGDLLDPSLSS